MVDQLMVINKWQQTMFAQRMEEVEATRQEMAARLEEKGIVFHPDMTDEEQNRAREIMNSEELLGLNTELQRQIALELSPAMFEITELTTLPVAFLSLLSIRPSESILTQLTGPNHDDLSPLSPSLLHFKPFVQVENKFYYFYHSAFEDRLTDIIENDIFARRPGDAFSSFFQPATQKASSQPRQKAAAEAGVVPARLARAWLGQEGGVTGETGRFPPLEWGAA